MSDSDNRLPEVQHPEQEEMPFAVVHGEAWSTLPKDLYIPPNALEVFLDTFEGPLDLLLYLIKRQNLDILDIPLTQITTQYMEYVDLMKELRLELAAEYLVMAAMLAEIKSRMLLPRHPESDEDEDDPRAELIRRLQEYERYKQAAADLDELPRMERDLLPTSIEVPDKIVEMRHPDVDMRELLLAMQEVMRRAELFSQHHVQMEPLSMRERMSIILDSVRSDSFIQFYELFTLEEGRMGVVVTLLATLELLKDSLIEIVQAEPFGPIHIKAVVH